MIAASLSGPTRTVAVNASDPRLLRSRRRLHEALIMLLEHRPFEQITIREIGAAAEVHYSTFFRHYPTKEALLESVAADRIRHLIDLTMRRYSDDDASASTHDLFDHVNAQRALWTTLLTGGAAGVMRAEMLRISHRLAAERRYDAVDLPVELAVNLSVSIIFETLAWWLGLGDAAPSTDEAAKLLSHLLSMVRASRDAR